MNAVRVICDRHGNFTIVDADDFADLIRHSWLMASNGYFVRSTTTKDRRRRHIMLHRQLLNAPPGLEVDHINGYRFDNRRGNLRLCTACQNQANQTRLSSDNTTGFLGVFASRNRRRWYAQLTVNYRTIHLGTFDSREEAAAAYNAAKLAVHGEFARLNQI